VAWPASGAVIPLGEAVRIVLLEATVHLVDAQRALWSSSPRPSSSSKLAAVMTWLTKAAIDTGPSTGQPEPAAARG
jgi:hypothetical protein